MDRQTLIDNLEKHRKTICAYGPKAATCDCKYGADSKCSEQTGCPELRMAIHILSRMTDKQFTRALGHKGKR